MKINYDYWWLIRQQWVESLQPKQNDAYIDAVLWCLLGIILTAILMVW